MRAFQAKCGESPGTVGAGVDADSVQALVHLLADGVAMDHELAVAAPVFEEGVADPAQIAGFLLVECEARADAGMNEEVVTLDNIVVERPQKGDLRRRNVPHHHVRQFGDRRLIDGRHVHAIAEQRFKPAGAQQQAQQVAIAIEGAKEDLFVIAAQAAPVGAVGAQRTRSTTPAESGPRPTRSPRKISPFCAAPRAASSAAIWSRSWSSRSSRP